MKDIFSGMVPVPTKKRKKRQPSQRTTTIQTSNNIK